MRQQFSPGGPADNLCRHVESMQTGLTSKILRVIQHFVQE